MALPPEVVCATEGVVTLDDDLSLPLTAYHLAGLSSPANAQLTHNVFIFFGTAQHSTTRHSAAQHLYAWTLCPEHSRPLNNVSFHLLRSFSQHRYPRLLLLAYISGALQGRHLYSFS